MKWTTYIGRVVVANPKDKLTIEVYCPDLAPFASTELIPNHYQVEIKDENDVISKLKISNLVRCVWKGQSNWYPPDIAVGEQVLVEVDEATQTFYWSAIGRDDRLRYRESVRLYCINKDRLQDPIDESHTYFFEMNSLDDGKYIILQTNKVAGLGDSPIVEPFTYRFKIDTKTGSVLLTDDIGNTFFLESEEHRITLTNADNSQLILSKKDIYLNSEQSITFHTKNINYICENENKYVEKNVDTTIDGNETIVITGDRISTINGNIVNSIAGTQTDTTIGNITITTNANFTFNGVNETHSTKNVMNLTASKIISDRVAQTVGGPALKLG